MSFNPEGDGNCQFAAIAHCLNQIGIFRSHETLRKEITKYLQEHPIGNDGTPLELFTAQPWNQYLASMTQTGTYGDHITLQAVANLYLVRIKIISTLGSEAEVIIAPQNGLPITTIVLGHMAENHGIHYLCLQQDVDSDLEIYTANKHGLEDASPEESLEENMLEGQDKGEKNSSSEKDTDNVGIKSDYDKDEHNKEHQNDEQTAYSESIVNQCTDYFSLLPNEIVDYIIRLVLSGLTRRTIISTYSTLHNVCSRFRRIVKAYIYVLPQIHFDANMYAGYHSVISVLRKYDLRVKNWLAAHFQ